MILHSSFGKNAKGNLTIGGADAVELASEYGTPLYVLDENKIRENCNIYKNAMSKYFSDAKILFASKSLSFKKIYEIIKDENIGIDVVSIGEMFTAKKAGFPLGNAYFHGNNKTDGDIRLAMENGVGVFVADNREEVDAIEQIAGELGKTQDILLRLSPGIDPHTHAKIATAKVDSKFGVAIETGQAIELVGYILEKKSINLQGIHCHIGSQILDIQPYIDVIDIMTDFLADVKEKYDVELAVLNIGGGFGVKYTETQEAFDYDFALSEISKKLNAKCSERNIKIPQIIIEPGRSIVAAAGATLYTAGSYKTITGYKSYVSVDGSMCDNPRYALYESPYTVVCANKMNEKNTITATIAGRCCESGDLIQEAVELPEIKRGDIIAVLVTGAYNYAMSLNYNRLPKPAIVMVKDGKPYLALKRETYDDLTRNDI